MDLSKLTHFPPVDLICTNLSTSIDFLLPLVSKTVLVNEPPWVNDQFKSLVRKRQVALAQGDLVNFRNHVNPLRKSCRAKYYASKVEHLRNYDSRRRWNVEGGENAWWNAITHFSRPYMGSDRTTEFLADTINNTFLAPMDLFTPLAPSSPSAVNPSNPPFV